MNVAPSSAAIASHTLTIDAATDSIDAGYTATAVLQHDFVALGTQDVAKLEAIVTSSNASTAGSIMLSVTDSFSSSGNDGTPTNSPRYSLGDRASTQ